MRMLFSFLFLLSFHASALEVEPYKEKDLDAAISDGKPHVLHFTAEWCSTCLHQRKILKELLINEDLKDIKVYAVDFDLEWKMKKKYKVERQSTFIIFRGGQEMSRSLGLVDKEKIIEQFKKGL